MKKITISISLLAIVLFLTSASFAQGRPAGAGAPTTPGIQGSRPSSPGQSTDRRPENPGKPESAGKSTDHQTESSARSADPTDTHGFKTYGLYVAATHVAENLHIDFNLLKTEMVDNKLSLGKAITKLRPDLSGQTVQVEVKKAEAAGKKAEAEAKKAKSTN